MHDKTGQKEIIIKKRAHKVKFAIRRSFPQPPLNPDPSPVPTHQSPPCPPALSPPIQVTQRRSNMQIKSKRKKERNI